MNPLEQLLRSFEREDVEEIRLATGRPPQGILRDGAGTLALGEEVWSTDALLAALVSFGGSRHVEELSELPRQWSARLAGLGMIGVAAGQRGDQVQARFRLLAPGGASLPPPRPFSAPPDARGASAPPPAETARLPPQRVIPTTPSDPPAGPLPDAGDVHRIETPVRPIPQVTALELSFDDLESPELDLPTTPRKPEPRPLPPPPAKAVQLPPQLPPTSPSIRSVGNHAGGPRPGAAARPNLSPSQAVVMAPSSAAPSLEALLASARQAHASDLHVIAGRPPLLRVAGELKAAGAAIAPDDVEAMLLPCVPDRLVSELVEQGSCDFALEDAVSGRFRVSVSRQQTGYAASVRLISLAPPTLDNLHVPDAVAAAARHAEGLIVFTGPLGHGKTTTMHAVVDHLNRATARHIVTVEDPVEHVHPKQRALMSQREVGSHTASFVSALDAALLEDPDVIVVGELADSGVVERAVAASAAGHLVLGAMSTRSAARTLDRLIEAFHAAEHAEARATLAMTLRLVVTQRLVPGREAGSLHAAFGVLPASVALAALIRDNKTFQIPGLEQRGGAAGVQRLDESLAKLVAEEKVALEAAREHADAPRELEALVKAARAR